MFLAVLLTLYQGSIGQTTVPVKSEFECEALVQTWANQTVWKHPGAQRGHQVVSFKAYCLPVKY